MIKVGIVGLGAVGQLAHLESFKATSQCRVEAVADLRPNLLAQVADKYGIARKYSSHHALLADPELDAVVIVVRRPATGPIVLDALASGKHVLCEKPMAHSFEQGRRLVKAADLAQRQLAVGYMKRYDPGVRLFATELDRLRRGGEWGAPCFIRVFGFAGRDGLAGQSFLMTDEIRPEGLALWPVAPDWLVPDLSGDYAAFLNVHSHMVNLLRSLFEVEPAIDHVRAHRHGQGITATLRWPEIDGVLEFGISNAGDWHEGIEVLFERGRLCLDLPVPLHPMAMARVRRISGDGVRTFIPDRTDWAFRAQARGFIDALRGWSAPLATGTDCLGDLEFIERLWQHIQQSRSEGK